MQISTYQTDLYLLPENEEEKKAIINFLEVNGYMYLFSYSDVKGQDWYKKKFIEIPFGSCLINEIKEVISKKTTENTFQKG